MKKILATLMAAVMTLAVTACGGTSGTKMTMGTGGTAGTYYGYGGVLGQYIKNNAGINVTVVSTDGSKANIQGIDAGNYQLGTVQSDVMSYAWEGTRSFETEGKISSFRTVAGLYAESVQLVTMDPTIKSVADLKGKAVSIGAPGSGVYFNAVDVLEAAGLTEKDIKPQYQSFADSADALKDGKIDAYLKAADEAQAPAEYDKIDQFTIGKEIRLSEGDHGFITPYSDNYQHWNEARDYFYPIPTDDIQLTNGALVQNPGWE